MLDPLDRWRRFGEKPDYAGLLTFAGQPYTESVAELDGVDVAIVGAPMDELVSDRPGARLGPRAIRAAGCPSGAGLSSGVDGFEVLRVVDFGDTPVVPADPARSHAAIEATVGDVVEAGAIPITLGGDHSIVEPALRACARVHGPLALIHFDTHTDTGVDLFGARVSHGTPMYRLVEEGRVVGARYAQVGLRGSWPGPMEFAWQKHHGITSLFMHDIHAHGIEEIVRRALDVVGDAPAYLSVDVDVLDPAFAPGTGSPEPGGMTSADLLCAVREVAAHATIVGADVVEVIPSGVGSADITALVADRSVREIITGLAVARLRAAKNGERG